MSYASGMARKTMVSLRLGSETLAEVDAQAKAAGQTRTEWLARSITRSALTAAGRPQNPQPPVDEPS